MLGVGKPRPIAFANGGCKSEGNSGPATTATGFRLQWLALAGFAQDDLEITFHSNLLSVSGKKQETSAEGYLHRGIAGRPFEHRFELADHVQVNGADQSNGLLSIDLVREIPEALKPRKISIQGEPALTSIAPAQIEAQEAA